MSLSKLANSLKHMAGKHSQKSHGRRGNAVTTNVSNLSADELMTKGYIPVYRGTGAEGMKRIRPSSEGVAGPGVYFYDDVLQARSYAERGGGVITGFVNPDDVVLHHVPSTGMFSRSHNVVVLKDPTKLIRRGDLSVEDTLLDSWDLKDLAKSKLDELR